MVSLNPSQFQAFCTYFVYKRIQTHLALGGPEILDRITKKWTIAITTTVMTATTSTTVVVVALTKTQKPLENEK